MRATLGGFISLGLSVGLLSCATPLIKKSSESTAQNYRDPAATPPAVAFNWALVQDAFQGGGWELVSPGQASRYSDLYFISDIHGRIVAFANLLYQAGLVDSKKIDPGGNAIGNWSGRNALLVLSGDYIDGGEGSAQVLKWLQTLSQQSGSKGSRLIILSGNHEAELLADPKPKDMAKETLKSFSDPNQLNGALSFIRSFKLGAVVGSWFIAHSGYIVPDSGRLRDWLGTMSSAWQAGQYKKLTDPEGTGVAGVLEKHDWWDKRHGAQHAILNSIGLNGFIAGHEPGFFGSDKEKILISNEGWAVKMDTSLKEEKNDSDTIGEMLHCQTNLVNLGDAGFKTLDRCERVKADGSRKSLTGP